MACLDSNNDLVKVHVDPRVNSMFMLTFMILTVSIKLVIGYIMYNVSEASG